MSEEIKPEPNVETPPPPRKFPYAVPHRWKHKKNGKEFKVVPWFQPLGEQSEFDYKGLLLEVLPEMVEDIMGSFDVYKGTVIHMGWQMLNDANVWFALPHSVKSAFEDLGVWKDEEGPAHVAMPLGKKKKAKKKAKKKKVRA